MTLTCFHNPNNVLSLLKSMTVNVDIFIQFILFYLNACICFLICLSSENKSYFRLLRATEQAQFPHLGPIFSHNACNDLINLVLTFTVLVLNSWPSCYFREASTRRQRHIRISVEKLNNACSSFFST